MRPLHAIVLLAAALPARAAQDPSLPAGKELTIQEIVKANAKAIASIHSLVVQTKFYVLEPEGEHCQMEYTWTWRGDEQRLRLNRMKAKKEEYNEYGDKPGLSDNYNRCEVPRLAPRHRFEDRRNPRLGAGQ